MAQRSAYISSAIRLEGRELRWGDPGCALCAGRGWHFLGETEEDLDVASCPYCSETESDEDEDRLNERLFITAAVLHLLSQQDAEFWEGASEAADDESEMN